MKTTSVKKLLLDWSTWLPMEIVIGPLWFLNGLRLGGVHEMSRGFFILDGLFQLVGVVDLACSVTASQVQFTALRAFLMKTFEYGGWRFSTII